jgi:hypothetical protein
VPQIHYVIEAVAVTRLNAQSPSKLGWRLRIEPGDTRRFETMLRWAHHLASWTVAATVCRSVIILALMG